MGNRRALPRRGEFDFQPLVGNFEPVVEDGSHLARYFDLSLESTWPYGVWWTESGTLYALHRNCQLRTTRSVVLQRADPGGDGLHVLPESFRAASGGTVRRFLDGDQDVYSCEQYPGGPTFDMRAGRQVSYRETLADGTSVLDLTGERLAPGFHVYAPWRGGGLYYTSLAWDSTGTFFGEPVTGFTLLDQSYLAHGEFWNDSRVWNEMQIVWGVFCNTYDDGDVEFGHFSWGAGQFRFIAVSDATETTTLTREGVTIDVDFGDDGFAKQTRCRGGGEEWVFTTLPHGNMIDASAARPGWRGHVGTCRRSDDSRTPVKSIGWTEIFPDRLRAALAEE